MIEKAKVAVALAQYCVPKGFGSPVCVEFWRVSSIITMVIAAIAFAMIVWLMLRNAARARKSRLLWEEHMRREDEVAPELRMQFVSWKGDKSLAAGVDEATLAAQISKELKKRKLNGS
jgi:flagellar biosynthesis/type III secretory pathway M-ring protein FliF/YscJ